MARLCLPKPNRDKIVQALKSGELSIERLYELPSASRRKVFASYVGDDFAKLTNAKFEQAMLSNQKKALGNWIKNISQLQEPIRRDMMKKVDRLKKVLTPDEEAGFFEDLARDKLGVNITQEEAETILKLKDTVDEFKAKVPDTSPMRSTERLEYGLAQRRFNKYVDELKTESNKLSAKERLKPENLGRNIVDAGGLAKSLTATLDISFPGRQGFKAFLNGNYATWAKGVGTSVKTFVKTLKNADDSVMDMVWADILSRPNNMNGKYKAAKNGYGLGVFQEEAFPVPLPERVPVIGRFFKASEDAYKATALRMRADLADLHINMAEKNGLDVTDEKVASGLGSFVSSLTGRGSWKTLEPISTQTNALFFSIRFLKANLDTLTAHSFDSASTAYSRKLARRSLFRILGSLGVMMAVAEGMQPGSTDTDPRKGRLGKIRIGQNDIDVTGGLGGLMQTASRIMPTKKDGKWGSWKYSQNTRKWTNMREPGYGESTVNDYLGQFIQGKFSPGAGMIRDFLENQNFDGEKPTMANSLKSLVIPISSETIFKGLQRGDDYMLTVALSEMLGFSSSPNGMKGYGKKYDALKEKVGEEKYNQSLINISNNFNKRAQQLEKTSAFKAMNNEDRSKALDKIRTEESDRVFNSYGIK